MNEYSLRLCVVMVILWLGGLIASLVFLLAGPGTFGMTIFASLLVFVAASEFGRYLGMTFGRVRR